MARNPNDGRGRVGGRSKGTPNKKTINAQAIADRLGIDPFEVLLLLATGDWKALGYKKRERLTSANEWASIYEDSIPVGVRASCAAQACNYLYPRRKAIDLKLDQDNVPIQILFVEKK